MNYKLWFLEGLCYSLAILIPLIAGGVFVNEFVTTEADAYSTGIVATGFTLVSFLGVAYLFEEWYDRTDEEE